MTTKHREPEFADLTTIQDLLGHEHVTTTQRYCRVANLKVQRDYYKAMELVLQKAQGAYDAGENRFANPGERSHEWRVVKRAKRSSNDLVDEITVDAYNDDEQLWAFRQVIEDEVAMPTDACALGEPVTVKEIDLRRERAERAHGEVSAG